MLAKLSTALDPKANLSGYGSSSSQEREISYHKGSYNSKFRYELAGSAGLWSKSSAHKVFDPGIKELLASSRRRVGVASGRNVAISPRLRGFTLLLPQTQKRRRMLLPMLMPVPSLISVSSSLSPRDALSPAAATTPLAGAKSGDVEVEACPVGS
ncbi:hypothetical protein NE237_004816 [Protea cynaroides]|uniref:Uncharacterized protein n=1 Tax=Protea cynaroides TaxID=273540 RepID=A0A9Q0KJK5_9MAGN|nr:hypothetical protein NE237_004816 [Protea cynaroides]